MYLHVYGKTLSTRMYIVADTALWVTALPLT